MESRVSEWCHLWSLLEKTGGTGRNWVFRAHNACAPLLKWMSVGTDLGSFLPSSALSLREVACSPQPFLDRAPKRMTSRKTSLA